MGLYPGYSKFKTQVRDFATSGPYNPGHAEVAQAYNASRIENMMSVCRRNPESIFLRRKIKRVEEEIPEDTDPSFLEKMVNFIKYIT